MASDLLDGSHLIDRVSHVRAGSLPFAAPKHSLSTTESILVADVLRMVQGFQSENLVWSESEQSFSVKKGFHLAHLSLLSLYKILEPFLSAASSLRRIELLVSRVSHASSQVSEEFRIQGHPTLQAFINVVSMRLQFLRKAGLDKELEAASEALGGPAVSLLNISSSLSWVCAGAVFLEHAVNSAIPDSGSFPKSSHSAAELASHILSALYTELNEFCLVQDGGEQAYRTLLLLFVGSLQPLADSLHTWLQEGILHDSAGELFFYGNSSMTVEDDAFWLDGYTIRSYAGAENVSQDSKQNRADAGKASALIFGTLSSFFSESVSEHIDQKWPKKLGGNLSKSLTGDIRDVVCPEFLQPFATAILSAGKSLQLLQFVWQERAEVSSDNVPSNDDSLVETSRGCQPERVGTGTSGQRGVAYEAHLQPLYPSVSTLPSVGSGSKVQAVDLDMTSEESCWHNSLFEQFVVSLQRLIRVESSAVVPAAEIQKKKSDGRIRPSALLQGNSEDESLLDDQLNIGGHGRLPALNDTELWQNIFTEACEVGHSKCSTDKSAPKGGTHLYQGKSNDRRVKKELLLVVTDEADHEYGNGSSSMLQGHAADDSWALEQLLPYPTFLPSFQECQCLSELVPTKSQIQATPKVLRWLQGVTFNAYPPPAVMVQECLIVHIEKQVKAVGQQLLDRLMGEWYLMEELALLRTIYLVGSGDLLQQFSTVLFNKLDRGEAWDDYYELNTMLQESIRSSANETLLPALDSVVVMVERRTTAAVDKVTSPGLHLFGQSIAHGIETLDNMRFVYKVAWPLELIIDANAIKRYNQVMSFILKVKRAKHVLDKACRFTWKNGGGHAANDRTRLLLQHKLMHFVNTLHQYVMDRVLYSAWVELCDGMSNAGSLDEVIACHDAYLTSIQRQCLVAPDKLWTLIASRVKTILGLALDYYSVQRTLRDGATAPTISARCESEIERIGKQFDECMVFLLRVLSFKLNIGHFPHLADLVTRINYNFYYMSEHGHVLTPIPDSQQHSGRMMMPGAGSRNDVVPRPRSAGRMEVKAVLEV